MYAAARLGDVLPELAEKFEPESGHRIRFNFAGSNVLAQQIVASNQADIYISANRQWMDYVEQRQEIQSSDRRMFVSNQLVIVANAATSWTIDAPGQLVNIPIRHLSIGDPNAVPAGTYAKAFLEQVAVGEHSLWEHFQSAVVPAPDVRAALNLVSAASDIIGIVYKTDAMAVTSVRVVYEIPPADSPPVRYFAARLQRPNASPAVRAFYEYLVSDEAARVLAARGFVTSASMERQP